MVKRMEKKRQHGLTVYNAGDPQSSFRDHSTAKEVLRQKGYPSYLLSRSAKTEKSRKLGVNTKVMYLVPGLFCPAASPGCLRSCLGHSSGRLAGSQAADARDKRSALYLAERELFMHVLYAEIAQHGLESRQQGLQAAVRLNGSSDIPWEERHPELFRMFPEVQFYDYTKLAPRMKAFLQRSQDDSTWPSNYHLTYSLSETNSGSAEKVLEAGGNVAAVFWPRVPSRWRGVEVIDGDASDARHRDPSPRYVGLSAKGVAKRELGGFVVRADTQKNGSATRVFAA